MAYRSVSDQAALKEYGRIAGPAIQAAGGKALVRTSDGIEARESGLSSGRSSRSSRVLKKLWPRMRLTRIRRRCEFWARERIGIFGLWKG